MGQKQVMVKKQPKHWANDLTHILNARDGTGAQRFPVDVKRLAYEYTAQCFPDDPISLVQGGTLPGFEGALLKAPKTQKGWGIFYNSAIQSSGRINFTLAHEFGHYLLHRDDYPEGIKCKAEDMTKWGSQYKTIENEANIFAATLLMPLDDYRAQIDDMAKPSLDDLGKCADRYGVSLISATLRWLLYTRRRSMLVKSIDGFVHWARSSKPAMQTGTYFKVVDRPPIPVPNKSLASQVHIIGKSKVTIAHEASTWFDEPCIEHVLNSRNYGYTLSLLHFGDIIQNAFLNKGKSTLEGLRG